MRGLQGGEVRRVAAARGVTGWLAAALIFAAALAAVPLIVRALLRCPFQEYPVCVKLFRKGDPGGPGLAGMVREYLKSGGLEELADHEAWIRDWERACKAIAADSAFPALRRLQYNALRDPDRAYEFGIADYGNGSRIRTSYAMLLAVAESSGRGLNGDPSEFDALAAMMEEDRDEARPA